MIELFGSFFKGASWGYGERGVVFCKSRLLDGYLFIGLILHREEACSG